jgi:hypothetical protein
MKSMTDPIGIREWVLSRTVITLSFFFFAIMPLAFRHNLFLRSKSDGITTISAFGLIKAV